MTDYERQEAVFAEVVSLTYELNKAISAAECVQDVKLNAQNIERLEQRISDALSESNATLQRARWLSTKSLAVFAITIFIATGCAGVITGTYIAHEKSRDLFAEQRAEQIARLSTQLASADVLVSELIERDATFYADMIVWNKDSDKISTGAGTDNETNQKVNFLRIED